MRIRKYDFDYGRRALMEKVAKGAAVGGVLTPVWPLIANGKEINKAYPDEMISIEANTKGKIKPGDILTSANVEHTKHLMDPIMYDQVKNQGRRIKIVEPTTDASTLWPQRYLKATLENWGRGAFDENGNTIDGKTGGPWVGGNPFPECKTGAEAMSNLCVSWGRHDYEQYAVRDWDINPDGSQAYQYDFVWAELQTIARTGPNKYFRDQKHLLRYNSVWFTSPQEQAGTSLLSTWYADERKFPDLYGYLPQFRRVRQFPTNQRFEPLVPGITLFLSDGWTAGDPRLTWGNYKIIDRKPHLGALKGNWWGGRHDNWEPNRHGGQKGETFFDSVMELVPEVIVVDSEPTGYPRAPVGLRRNWIDVRNGACVGYVTFDRKGQVWKQVEVSTSQKIDGDTVLTDPEGHPEWSWNWVHIQDLQSTRMSALVQAKEIAGGYKTLYDGVDEDEYYEKYLTINAITRLGAV